MNNVARVLSAFTLAGLLLIAGCPATLLDDYEPNDTLAEAFDLGTVEANTPEKIWTATISPKADVDFYTFLAKEESGFGIPFEDEIFALTVRMVPPQAPDARDYDLFLYNNAGSLLDSSSTSGAVEETIVVTWDGVCGAGDSFDFYIEIRGVGGGSSATPYTLYAHLLEEMAP